MIQRLVSCSNLVFRLLGLVFWNSIHVEVASDSFCFLCNCSWLLVFILYVFFMIFSGFNLYCWKGIHFSENNFLIFLLLFQGQFQHSLSHSSTKDLPPGSRLGQECWRKVKLGICFQGAEFLSSFLESCP